MVTSGAIESHRKPQLTKKNLIFCYEILSGKVLPSRMTVLDFALYADGIFLRNSVLLLFVLCGK